MLSVAGAVNSASYYMSQDNYYFLGESDARWMGKGAQALGLDGPVLEEDFARGLEGKLPGEVDLTRMSGGKNAHRPGYDLTLSAPKSVSVMAVVLGDRRFLEAHNRAVEVALGEVEKLATTRVMQDGVREIVPTGNLVVAAFNHDTSRELDPQAHTHLVVLNATQHEGEWKTLATDTKGKAGFIENVYALQVALGKVYRNTLRQDVEAMGFLTREVGSHGMWEMEGVPVEVFSTRSQQIREAVGDEATLKSRDVAALDTRKAKQKEPDRVELLTDWFTRLDKTGFDAKVFREAAVAREAERADVAQVAREPVASEVQMAVSQAISLLSDKRTRFSYSDVLNHTLNALDGREKVAVMARAAIDVAIEEQRLIPLDKEKGMFTSSVHLMDELSLQQVAQTHKESVTVPVLSSQSTARDRTVQALATERPSLAIVQRSGGAAGMRDAVEGLAELATSQGREVQVLATDRATERWLGGHASIADKVTGLSALAESGLQPGSTLIVASAEKLSVKEALSVTDTALRQKVQVLFVDGGGRNGTGNALGVLGEAGVSRYQQESGPVVQVTVNSTADKQARYGQLAQDYVALSAQGEVVVAQVSGVREQTALTASIREQLRESGVLSDKSVQAQTLTPQWLDSKTRRQLDSYREGMVLERRTEDVRFPERYTLDRVNPATRSLSLTDAKGYTTQIKLSELDSRWTLYQKDSAEIAEGEQLTWKARQSKLRSGDTVTVTKVHKSALEVEHNGKTLMIDTSDGIKAGYGYVASPGAVVREQGIVLGALSARNTGSTMLNQLARSGNDVRLYTPLSQDETDRRMVRSALYRSAVQQVNPEGKALSGVLDEARDSLMSVAEKAVSQAITLTQGSEVTFSRLDVTVNALPLHASLKAADVEREMNAQIVRGELLPVPGVKGAVQQQFVTAATYDAEKRMLTLVAEGLNTQAPLMSGVDAALLTGLTPGQQQASGLMLKSTDRFIGVQGYAGVGKTTQMKAVLGALETLPAAVRPEVIGLAPTHRAVGEMAAVGVKSQTLASFLMDTERRMQAGEKPDFSRTLFLVDESSMVGNRDLADAMSRIAAGGGRGVLSGDRDQLLPVENGAPFGLLQDRSALEKAIMKDIVRQTPALKPAMEAMVARKLGAALSTVESVTPDTVPREAGRWSPHASVMEFKQTKKQLQEDGDRVIAAIADDYTGRTAEARAQTLIVTQTNHDKNAINTAIHDDLRSRGLLGRGTRLTVLDRVKTQSDRLKSVAGMAKEHGNIALINDRYYSIRATGEGNQGGYVELVDEQGRAHAFTAFESSLRDVAIFKQRNIGVAVGEKVSFTRSDRERGREANSNWTVSAIDRDGRIELTQGDQTRILNPAAEMADRHLDYGYAGTAHKAQGASERFVIMLAGTRGGRQMLASHRDAYVALTRAKEHVQIVSDNLDKWMQTVQGSGDRATAHDVLQGSDDRQAGNALRVWDRARPLENSALGRVLARMEGGAGEARLVTGSAKYPTPHLARAAYDDAGKLRGVLLSDIRLSQDGALEGINPESRLLGSERATNVVIQRSENGLTRTAHRLQDATALAAAHPETGVVLVNGEAPQDRIIRNISGGIQPPTSADIRTVTDTAAVSAASSVDPLSLKTSDERALERALDDELRRQADQKSLNMPRPERETDADEQAVARDLQREYDREQRQLDRDISLTPERDDRSEQPQPARDVQTELRQAEREIIKEKTYGE